MTDREQHSEAPEDPPPEGGAAEDPDTRTADADDLDTEERGRAGEQQTHG